MENERLLKKIYSKVGKSNNINVGVRDKKGFLVLIYSSFSVAEKLMTKILSPLYQSANLQKTFLSNLMLKD